MIPARGGILAAGGPPVQAGSDGPALAEYMERHGTLARRLRPRRNLLYGKDSCQDAPG